ncbi:hypothetical protein Bca101_054065 [Brassica carinata]
MEQIASCIDDLWLRDVAKKLVTREKLQEMTNERVTRVQAVKSLLYKTYDTYDILEESHTRHVLQERICDRRSRICELCRKGAKCGVCQRGFSSGYGGYACIDKTCGYVAHSTCATNISVWDGIDHAYGKLEEVMSSSKDASLEEMDAEIVHHFSHDHSLSRIHVDEECWQLCEAYVSFL